MQEDLDAKMHQRLELVAQREDLEELHKQLEKTYGDDFDFFLNKIRKQKEIKELELQGILTARSDEEFEQNRLIQEYEFLKKKTFFSDLILEIQEEIRNQNSYSSEFDELHRLIRRDLIPLEKAEDKILEVSHQYNIQIDKSILDDQLTQMSKSIPSLFSYRMQKI